LICALFSQLGESRTVLTSRIRPVIPGQANDRLCTLPIHSLSLDESVLLARNLPNLGALLRGERAANEHERSEHRQLVKRVLRVVQGHAKLIELAEGQAASAADLFKHLDRATVAGVQGSVGEDRLGAFFREGDSHLEADYFLQALAGWATAIAATLPKDSHTLFLFLWGLEEEDRDGLVVDGTWPKLWNRLALAGTRRTWLAHWPHSSQRDWSTFRSIAATNTGSSGGSTLSTPALPRQAGRPRASDFRTPSTAYWRYSGAVNSKPLFGASPKAAARQ
jgi:hypothetical protein